MFRYILPATFRIRNGKKSLFHSQQEAAHFFAISPVVLRGKWKVWSALSIISCVDIFPGKLPLEPNLTESESNPSSYYYYYHYSFFPIVIEKSLQVDQLKIGKEKSNRKQQQQKWLRNDWYWWKYEVWTCPGKWGRNPIRKCCQQVINWTAILFVCFCFVGVPFKLFPNEFGGVIHRQRCHLNTTSQLVVCGEHSISSLWSRHMGRATMVPLL